MYVYADAVEFSTRLLQKVFRGYRGRARFRRLCAKSAELQRQRRRRLAQERALLATRRGRDRLATAIQRQVRGWLWRKRLALMRRSALTIQCVARVRRARSRVAAERRRRDGGPEVVDMTGEGVGRSCLLKTSQGGGGGGERGGGGVMRLTLKVFRCGDHYRLLGLDPVDGVEVEGEVRCDEVRALIDAHNARIEGTTLAARQQRVGLWQHERVVELIVANLGLAHTVSSLGCPRGAGGLRLVARPHVDPSIHGVQRLKGQEAPPSASAAAAASFSHQQQLLAMFKQYNLVDRRRRVMDAEEGRDGKAGTGSGTRKQNTGWIQSRKV